MYIPGDAPVYNLELAKILNYSLKLAIYYNPDIYILLRVRRETKKKLIS